MPATRAVDAGEMKGVLVDTEYLVLFSRRPVKIDSVTYPSVGTERTKHVLFNMQPSTAYRVVRRGESVLVTSAPVSGAVLEVVFSSFGGVVVFDFESTGVR